MNLFFLASEDSWSHLGCPCVPTGSAPNRWLRMLAISLNALVKNFSTVEAAPDGEHGGSFIRIPALILNE